MKQKKLKSNSVDKEQFFIFNVSAVDYRILTLKEKEELSKIKEGFYKNMQEGKLIGQ